MASPYVAAAAALIDAAHPGLTPDQVEQALESTAVDLGSAGKDNDYGYGRIDAAAAVAAAAAIGDPSTTPATSAPVTTPTTEVTTTPTTSPTTDPTTSPTTDPTTSPTAGPTTSPTADPTTSPTAVPTTSPTTEPTASPAPVKITPVITTVGARNRTVFYGTIATATFYVRVDGALAKGRAVQLCTAGGASATFTCKAALTTSAGSVVSRVTVTGPYRVKLIVGETATTAAVSSAVYSTTVQALARLTVRNPATLTAIVTGAVGQSVQVQRQTGRTTSPWTVFRTYAAVPVAAVTGVARGYRYRLVVASTPAIGGYTSTSVTP
jgi:hypothetical protein